MKRVLLLAGTAEARALAEALAAEAPDLAVTAALAGVTRAPRPLPVPVRIGGFGGAEGLADWLRAEGVAAVIDATHPFAARMAANAAAACAATGVPRVKLLRPGWAGAGGACVRVADLAAAARAIPPGARVFLATGSGEVADFAARPDLTCHLRLLTPRGDLPGHITAIAAPPGADATAEAALLARLGVTHLVARDAGGPAVAKLAAARALGLAVVLIARPAPPPGPQVSTVAAALAWLGAALAAAD